jgi:hypothetical protein
MLCSCKVQRKLWVTDDAKNSVNCPVNSGAQPLRRNLSNCLLAYFPLPATSCVSRVR